MAKKTMYRVGMTFTSRTGLSAWEIERETEKFVSYCRGKEGKNSEAQKWFDDIESARTCAIRRANMIIRNAEETIKSAKADIEKITAFNGEVKKD